MAEVKAPETQASTPQPAPAKPPVKGKKNNKKKMIKRVVAISVVVAILAGIGFGMWYLVFRDDGEVGAPLTDFAHIGSIQSVVQGYGNAVPKESAAITLNSAGTVEALYVSASRVSWFQV